ncbi:MAG: FAD binding domain-containing protein [Candidatus Kariarchaeaceae archaeon]
MYNVKNYYYPKSIEESLSLLQNPKSKLIAGGTAITLVNESAVESLIDLQELGLSYIKDDGDQIKIGAMTPVYDLYVHPDLPASLRNTADNVGDIPLLNAVTVGGNLAVLYPWVDLPPMLWALNSTITLYDPEEKKLSSDEFFAYSKEKNIGQRKALITEIKVQKPVKSSFSEFQCLTLINNERSQLNLASFLSWEEDGSIKDVRLVVSAATKLPERLHSAENLLKGKQINSELIDECIKKAQDIVDIVPNYKSSKKYRKEILGVYIKRTLNNSLKKIEEGRK